MAILLYGVLLTQQVAKEGPAVNSDETGVSLGS